MLTFPIIRQAVIVRIRSRRYCSNHDLFAVLQPVSVCISHQGVGACTEMIGNDHAVRDGTELVVGDWEVAAHVRRLRSDCRTSTVESRSEAVVRNVHSIGFALRDYDSERPHVGGVVSYADVLVLDYTIPLPICIGIRYRQLRITS